MIAAVEESLGGRLVVIRIHTATGRNSASHVNMSRVLAPDKL